MGRYSGEYPAWRLMWRRWWPSKLYRIAYALRFRYRLISRVAFFRFCEYLDNA